MKSNRSVFRTAGTWNSIIHVAIPVIIFLTIFFILAIVRVFRGAF